MRILVIDDSKAMRMIVKRNLCQAGYESAEFVEAGDGKEGLEAIHAGRPDLVLCDWNMPEMTGIELLEALQAEGTELKFGFVTSESTPDMRRRAVNAGVFFFITKPFTADSFKDAIGQVA